MGVELIINAAGKNMSPANIESALKSASPLIGQACVIGDRRPYNTALLVLDVEYASSWAAEAGLGELPLDELGKCTPLSSRRERARFCPRIDAESVNAIMTGSLMAEIALSEARLEPARCGCGRPPQGGQGR